MWAQRKLLVWEKFKGVFEGLKGGVKNKKMTKMHVGYQMKGIFNVISNMCIVIGKVFLRSR